MAYSTFPFAFFWLHVLASAWIALAALYQIASASGPLGSTQEPPVPASPNLLRLRQTSILYPTGLRSRGRLPSVSVVAPCPFPCGKIHVARPPMRPHVDVELRVKP